LNKYKKLFFLIVTSFLFFLFIFNDLGLLKWYQLERKKNQLKLKINKLIDIEKNLISDIDNIKNNDEYLEKMAREKFQMVKPGEKVFKIVNQKK